MIELRGCHVLQCDERQQRQDCARLLGLLVDDTAACEHVASEADEEDLEDGLLDA